MLSALARVTIDNGPSSTRTCRGVKHEFTAEFMRTNKKAAIVIGRTGLLVWLVVIAVLPGCAPTGMRGSLVIVGVTAIDPASGAVTRNATIVIRYGKIASVEPGGPLPGDVARQVDGHGLTAIPGLWDAHVHLSKARASAISHLIAWGVTSVRDVGGDPEELARWRREIERGDRVGPRIFMAGPYLESAERLRRQIASDDVEPYRKTRWPVGQSADVDAVVARAVAAGADFLKMRTRPSPEVFVALGQAAQRAGLKFAAHVDGLAPQHVIDAGLDSIEHMLPDRSAGKTSLEQMYLWLAETGGVITPTLVTWERSMLPVEDASRAIEKAADQRLISAFLLSDWREQLGERRNNAGLLEYYRSMYEKNLQAFRAARSAGVRMLAGSDLTVLTARPGAALHAELGLLVSELGLSELDALRAATVWPSDWMERPDLGRLEPGALADLVLLSGDPLEDISNTRKIRAVIAAGKLYDADALTLLKKAARDAPDVAVDDWGRPARSGRD